MTKSKFVTQTTNPLITQVRSLIHRDQHIDTTLVFAQIRELEQAIERYETAGFTSLANVTRTKLRPHHDVLRRAQQEYKTAQLRDLGYLIIDLPKWDGYYQRTVMGEYEFLRTKPSSRRQVFNHIPGKILKYGRRGSLTALWMVQTQNFTSPVPDFVIDRVLEEQQNFTQFDILFIARKSKLLNIVRDFDVMVDPILIGRWSVGQRPNRFTPGFESIPTEHHAAVLAMWGDDLEEIDLALALSQEAKGQ